MLNLSNEQVIVDCLIKEVTDTFKKCLLKQKNEDLLEDFIKDKYENKEDIATKPQAYYYKKMLEILLADCKDKDEKYNNFRKFELWTREMSINRLYDEF